MGISKNYEQELYDVVTFAIREYGDATMMKKELMENGQISETFGSCVADISLVTAEKNRLYLRRYDIKTNDGELVGSFILGHVAMLFGVSARRFREELLAKENVAGVATLKQSVFEHIVMPAAIILLNNANDDTWFAAASSIKQLVGMLCGVFSEDCKVYRACKPCADNLLPEFYNGDDQVIEESFSGSEVKELADVASVIAGKGAKREDYADRGIPYLRARDIQDGKVVMPDVFINAEKAELFSRQLVQEGDILLTKNFGQNKLALVTENDLPAIASNALFILRPFEVSEGYLYRYLTSKTGNEIFNKQIKRIQRGVTIPSVALSDLIHVKVPIFDDETMMSLASMDSISKEDAIKTSRYLIKRVTTESAVEMNVKEMFLSVGWKNEQFVYERDTWIAIGRDRKWRPDFVYILDDGRKVIIEVKTDLTRINMDWLSAMKYILSSEENYIFILTTGAYYEVHISGIDKSFQSMGAPTIDEILNWEKEVR